MSSLIHWAPGPPQPSSCPVLPCPALPCPVLACPGLWPLASGLWPLASGLWPLASGLWPLASGLWPLASPVVRRSLGRRAGPPCRARRVDVVEAPCCPPRARCGCWALGWPFIAPRWSSLPSLQAVDVFPGPFARRRCARRSCVASIGARLPVRSARWLGAAVVVDRRYVAGPLPRDADRPRFPILLFSAAADGPSAVGAIETTISQRQPTVRMQNGLPTRCNENRDERGALGCCIELTSATGTPTRLRLHNDEPSAPPSWAAPAAPPRGHSTSTNAPGGRRRGVDFFLGESRDTSTPRRPRAGTVAPHF